MRVTWSLILVLLVAAGGTFAADKGEPTAEIRAVLDRQVAAWNRGDIDGYMNGYVRSDKLEFVSNGKVTRGWQTVRDRYRKKYNSRAAMGTLKFSHLKITLQSPTLAQVTGRWELRREKDRPHGSFVLTFRRQPEGWRHRPRQHLVATYSARYNGACSSAASSFAWMPSKPPLLKIATTSFSFRSGTSFSIMCAASGS